MGDCSDICGCHPDSGHGPSGRTTVRHFFKNFAKKSFLFKICVRMLRHCRPDGRTSAASNFHIRLSRVWTMGDEPPDG
jgi:hypothetical protein